MTQHISKKRIQAEQHDFKKNYPLEEGIALVQKNSTTKFDSSIDIAINLNIDPKKPLQMVRGSVILPHGTGRTPRILVLCTPDKEKEAQTVGADHIGLDDYLQKIEKGWTDIDVIITMPMLMARIGKLGKILGPAGLMPTVKSGTVTTDIATAVKEIKAGKITLKTDKAGIVHTSVGRVSFKLAQLKSNVEEILQTLTKLKHNTVKGNYIKKVTLSSTMGPGVMVSLATITSLST